jgi:hypothetical protein
LLLVRWEGDDDGKVVVVVGDFLLFKYEDEIELRWKEGQVGELLVVEKGNIRQERGEGQTNLAEEPDG